MKLKQLNYRSIEELENQINRRKLLRTNGDGQELIVKLQKLDKPLNDDDMKDQEECYLNYSNILILNDEIKKSRIYNEDKKYGNAILTNPDKLIKYRQLKDRLREQLIERYNQNKILNFKSTALNNFNDLNLSTTTNQQDYITCKELYELFEKLHSEKKYLLLIDLRRKDDYSRSYIRIDDRLASCLITINIPENKIEKASTCSTIEQLLNENELNHFKNRNHAHLVVLMDYESTSLQANDKLFKLYQALTKVN